MEKGEAVNHPSHYTKGKIEVIDFIISCGWGLGFCLGNAVKYQARAEHKSKPEEDLRKAAWYQEHARMILKAQAGAAQTKEEIHIAKLLPKIL